MVLGTGDVVPADVRLFEAKDFKVSEMALTGARDVPARGRREALGGPLIRKMSRAWAPKWALMAG